MNPAPARRGGLTLRLRIALLVLVPLVAGVVAVSGFVGPAALPDAPDSLEQRSDALAGAFEDLLARAASTAEAGLASPVREVFRRPRQDALSRRLEGMALLGPDLEPTEWAGTPVEAGPLLAAPEPRRYQVRLDGVRTRLVVVSPPDERGRIVLVAYVLDGRIDDERFEDLLPESLTAGVGLETRFVDTEAALASRAPGDWSGSPTAPGDVPPRSLTLRAPDGTTLGELRLMPIPDEHVRERRIARARAWASAIFLTLLLVLFDWPALARGRSGLAATLGAIVGGRILLVLVRLPAVLLPAGLGSAERFGTVEYGPLLGSPADLCLTAVALYLSARAIRRRVGSSAGSGRGARLAVLLPLASAFTAATIEIVLAVSRNSSVPMLDPTAPPGWNGRTLVLGGLIFALLAAAELWGAAWTSLAPRSGDPASRPPRIPVAVALIALALTCSLVAQRVDAGLALERLHSEFAPQVREQSIRRSVALSAAVRHVNATYQEGAPTPPPSGQRDYLAYRFWVGSDLFLSGYKSSLDFYTPAGELVSHFAFGLPDSFENITFDPGAAGELVVREEFDDKEIIARRHLLHAEMAIVRDGEPLGVVVGHILDEPDNLPFLPGSQIYLAALGPGAPYRAEGSFVRELEYVLYDTRGRVRYSSLSRAPAETPDLLRAAASGDEIRVRAGDRTYFGLALDDGESTHLLLLPERSPVQHVATGVRLALAAMVLFGVLTLVPLLLPPWGPAHLLRRLRESFHRKLVAALLAASIIPLVGLSLVLRSTIAERSDEEVLASATRFVGAAQRQLEDYAALSLSVEEENGETDRQGFVLTDELMYWLAGVLNQEIHVFDDGQLMATSQRELFASGLMPPRMDGDVYRRLVLQGRPSLVKRTAIGDAVVPVAYAPLRTGEPGRNLVVAVPIVLELREIAQEVQSVVEIMILATVSLVGLLSIAAALLARTVGRPVRELAAATGRIAEGDYGTRLEPRTRDELAGLVAGFNRMAGSLSEQRADLERRRDHMERLLRHATAGVIGTDPDGRIDTLNPAAVALLAPAGDALRPGAGLVDTLARTPELAPLARVLDAPLEQAAEPVDVDLDLDGEARRYRVVRVPLPDPSGGTVGRLVLMDDVTDLMRSNQLAAWAEMARAIAHEIKNPLTPIQLSTEHLQRLLRDRGTLPDAAVEACLETIIKQVRSLYQIAGEFSAYAKLPGLSPETTDPVAFMRAAIGPYRAAPPDGVTIDERYKPAGAVAIDVKVLSRAVVNLVENALHAMPEGGTLTASVDPAPDARGVLLAVADTGTGLEREVRRRLFEPYFSTKSSGTGLGLAIVRRAVEAHHGTIEVASEEGRGTRFTIRLPLAQRD